MSNRDPGPAALFEAARMHALALAMYDAAFMQQQNAITRQAVTVMACFAILSFGSAEVAEVAKSPVSPPLAEAGTAAAPSGPLSVPAALAVASDKLPPPSMSATASNEFDGVYRSVAQSTALALQDAADYLRNVATLTIAANGAALAQLIANPGSTADYAAAQTATEQLMAAALANFEAIAASSENLLKRFPRR